ncbi:glycosyltransferase family 2 protein [Azorhizobium sp. AG788]|uniref:glycosyltransferase family 2 protein n=1 Tax=Azorhizobium sp. AG788 TaxID=2183897 RepID=UPI003138855F
MNAAFTPEVATAVPAPRDAEADVMLSICIPTYNRGPFLDYLLTDLATNCRFDFRYEIVVSDNASPDNTTEIVEKHKAAGLPISYFRQSENKGGYPNMTTAFMRAVGKYVFYLADDDLIIPEAVADNIHFLMDNPDVRAVYAPWEMYDDLNKVSSGLFYDQGQDLIVIRPGEEIDLLTLIIEKHIFPEVMIYRADALRNIIRETRFCYWAFSYLAVVASQGPVAFRNKPYYRSVTLTPVAPTREQWGVEETMTNWDTYRGGLEYMVFSLLRQKNMTLNDTTRGAFRDMVDHFVATRMRVALRLWMGRRDYLRAYELVARLCHLSPSSLSELEYMDQLPLLLAAQTLARLANAIVGIDRIVMAGVDDGQSLGSLLRDVGLERRILVSPPIKTPTAKILESSLVFLGDESLRQSFLDQGYKPGLIISEADIRVTNLL